MQPPDGFEDFMLMHDQSLRRLAYVLTLDATQAEDLAQVTYLRIVSAWSRVSSANEPGAYARKVMVNEHRKTLRGSRSIVGRNHELNTATRSPMEDVERRIEAKQLLGQISPRQRAAIALRYLEDRTYDEISQLLGCREATARSLVKRGLDAIRHAEKKHTEEVKQ